MTRWWRPWPDPAPDVWKRGVFVLLRVSASVSVLFATYFLLPTRTTETGFGVPWLILEMLIFGVVVGLQVPAIVGAQHPILRAVESLAILISVYLLIFSRIYLSNSLNDPAGFSRALDHTTALYFTVTVFATVGFGDIVAQTNSMRLLVTVQMLLNLAVIGLVIRLLTSAARRGVARRGGLPELGERDPF